MSEGNITGGSGSAVLRVSSLADYRRKASFPLITSESIWSASLAATRRRYHRRTNPITTMPATAATSAQPDSSMTAA